MKPFDERCSSNLVICSKLAAYFRHCLGQCICIMYVLAASIVCECMNMITIFTLVSVIFNVGWYCGILHISPTKLSLMSKQKYCNIPKALKRFWEGNGNFTLEPEQVHNMGRWHKLHQWRAFRSWIINWLRHPQNLYWIKTHMSLVVVYISASLKHDLLVLYINVGTFLQ